MGRLTGMVVGDRLAAVAPDVQASPASEKKSRLRLDAPLTDLVVAVVQGEDPGGDAGRVLAVLVERPPTGSGSLPTMPLNGSCRIQPEPSRDLDTE
jgi:hypothetical protein